MNVIKKLNGDTFHALMPKGARIRINNKNKPYKTDYTFDTTDHAFGICYEGTNDVKWIIVVYETSSGYKFWDAYELQKGYWWYVSWEAFNDKVSYSWNDFPHFCWDSWFQECGDKISDLVQELYKHYKEHNGNFVYPEWEQSKS